MNDVKKIQDKNIFDNENDRISHLLKCKHDFKY